MIVDKMLPSFCANYKGCELLARVQYEGKFKFINILQDTIEIVGFYSWKAALKAGPFTVGYGMGYSSALDTGSGESKIAAISLRLRFMKNATRKPRPLTRPS